MRTRHGNANALISRNYHSRMYVAVVPTVGDGGGRGLIRALEISSRISSARAARHRHGISITVREVLPVTCPCPRLRYALSSRYIIVASIVNPRAKLLPL